MAKQLGKLVAVYGISAAHQQRAVFIAVLSFVFFLAMMIGYYVREYIGYFLLASAFLFIYLVMMFSWFWQRKQLVEIFEKGLRYKGNDVTWNEIESVSEDGKLTLTGFKREVVIPRSMGGFDELIGTLRRSQKSKPYPAHGTD